MFSFLSLVQAFADRFSNPGTTTLPSHYFGRWMSLIGLLCSALPWYLYGLAFTSVCQSQCCIKYNCNIEMLLLYNLNNMLFLFEFWDIVLSCLRLFVLFGCIWLWSCGVVFVYVCGGRHGIFTFKSILDVSVLCIIIRLSIVFTSLTSSRHANLCVFLSLFPTISICRFVSIYDFQEVLCVFSSRFVSCCS